MACDHGALLGMGRAYPERGYAEGHGISEAHAHGSPQELQLTGYNLTASHVNLMPCICASSSKHIRHSTFQRPRTTWSHTASGMSYPQTTSRLHRLQNSPGVRRVMASPAWSAPVRLRRLPRTIQDHEPTGRVGSFQVYELVFPCLVSSEYVQDFNVL